MNKDLNNKAINYILELLIYIVTGQLFQFKLLYIAFYHPS
jgi:hypothetical protein